MLFLFRTNQASLNLLLFFYTFLLQLVGWLTGVSAPPTTTVEGVLAKWFISDVAPDGWWNLLLPALLIAGQAVGLNVLVVRHRMSRKITLLAGVFVIICWAMVPAFRGLQSVQFAGLFAVFALLSLGGTYKKNDPAVRLFNVGVWLGIGSLFCPPTLLLLPAFVVGLGALGRVRLRSVLQIVTGAGLTYFLTFSWAYYTGQTEMAWAAQTQSFGFPGFSAVTPASFIGMIIFIVLGLLALANYGKLTQLLTIEGKKNASILLWFLLFAGCSFLLANVDGLGYLQLLVLPIGCLLGLRFNTISDGQGEFLHLVLVTATILPTLYFSYG